MKEFEYPMWFKCIEDGKNYCTYEGDENYFNAIEIFATKKVKLLDTYEVTLWNVWGVTSENNKRPRNKTTR